MHVGKLIALYAGSVALSCGSMAFVTAVPAAANVAAGPTTAVDDVLVSTSDRFVVTNGDPGHTIRFRRDGVAMYDGRLAGRDGHYESAVDFGQIEQVVAESKLCERAGISTFIQARASRPGVPHVLIQVRCASETRTYNDDIAQDIPAVATALLKSASGLQWRYTGPAQLETIVRFAQ